MSQTNNCIVCGTKERPRKFWFGRGPMNFHVWLVICDKCGGGESILTKELEQRAMDTLKDNRESP